MGTAILPACDSFWYTHYHHHTHMHSVQIQHTKPIGNNMLVVASVISFTQLRAIDAAWKWLKQKYTGMSLMRNRSTRYRATNAQCSEYLACLERCDNVPTTRTDTQTPFGADSKPNDIFIAHNTCDEGLSNVTRAIQAVISIYEYMDGNWMAKWSVCRLIKLRNIMCYASEKLNCLLFWWKANGFVFWCWLERQSNAWGWDQ